jgi:hypothetical protein
VTQHQDLSFALARVISCDPEQSAEDEVTEGEEHRRMILSLWPLGGTMVSDPFTSATACTADAVPDARWASITRDGSTATTRRSVGSYEPVPAPTLTTDSASPSALKMKSAIRGSGRREAE